MVCFKMFAHFVHWIGQMRKTKKSVNNCFKAWELTSVKSGCLMHQEKDKSSKDINLTAGNNFFSLVNKYYCSTNTFRLKLLSRFFWEELSTFFIFYLFIKSKNKQLSVAHKCVHTLKKKGVKEFVTNFFSPYIYSYLTKYIRNHCCQSYKTFFLC